MERDTYLLIKDEGKEKKKSKKLDWIIYGLAVISFVLMVIVIIHNNKTSIEVLEPEKTVIVQKQEKTGIQLQDDILAKEKAEKQKAQEAQLLAQKQAEEQKALQKAEESKKESLAKEEAQRKEALQKEELSKTKIAKEEKSKAVESKKVTTKQEKVVTEKAGTQYTGKYNWKVLSRYKVKPDANLSVVSSYTVQQGDALWKIAEKYHVKNINLVAVNPQLKNPNFILPGQVIHISNK